MSSNKYYETVVSKIQAGLEGLNMGIETGYEYLDTHYVIRKGIYTVVFGQPGSGKSTFVYNSFILNPFDRLITGKSDVDFNILFFCMERSLSDIYAKWIIKKIYEDTGKYIPLSRMLGWRKNEKLTQDELDMIMEYRDYFKELDKKVQIEEGPKTSRTIYDKVKEFVQLTPSDSLKIVIIDHINIIDQGNAMNKKQAIDAMSNVIRYLRDKLGVCVVVVAQTNRDTGAFLTVNNEEKIFEPTADALKDSGSPNEDADVVINIYDPLIYNANDANYDAKLFKDKLKGVKYFRGLKIIKNTYGPNDIKVGFAFNGAIGSLKELPAPNIVKSWQQDNYDEIFKWEYFRRKKVTVEKAIIEEIDVKNHLNGHDIQKIFAT